MKRWLALLPIVVLVALAVFLMTQMDRMAGDPAAGPTYRPDALVGQPIPETTVLPILVDGKAGSDLLDLKTAGVGKPMIVNVFASWCAPCRLEHPQLIKLKEQGVAVVGVAYKDDPVATDAFLQELGDPYRLVLVDREGRAGLNLGVSGVPESFAVDAFGTIVAKSSGPVLTDADLKTLTDALNASAR
ncbi:DsbE family thiol:disulfide interchange protein [Brevundimonas sp.]|uniref:DsbE family thiol:disulfide interchange protein n=1 Tax=Brevundimonas sp. TaxID=1871086 RepID=UPI00289EB1ED|nr:DsbE family thiol:disulfide interchange protein [Brevundimonas sp.]